MQPAPAQPQGPLALNLLDLDSDVLSCCIPLYLLDFVAAASTCTALRQVCTRQTLRAALQLPDFVGRLEHEAEMKKLADVGNSSACLRLGLCLIYGTLGKIEEGMQLLRRAKLAGGMNGADAAYELYLLRGKAHAEAKPMLDFAVAAGHKVAIVQKSGMPRSEVLAKFAIPANGQILRHLQTSQVSVATAHVREWWPDDHFIRDGRDAIMGIVTDGDHLLPATACEGCFRWRFLGRTSSEEKFAERKAAVEAAGGVFNPLLALQACSQCMVAHYCSRVCQMAQWRAHKRECRAMAAPVLAD